MVIKIGLDRSVQPVGPKIKTLICLFGPKNRHAEELGFKSENQKKGDLENF